MDTQPNIFLFTNFGTLKTTTPEEARVTHNAIAGNPSGVAAAKALGDLSHLVFAPVGDWSGKLIFLDQWTSADGLQQFFADKDVQGGAARLFSAFEPIVWRPEAGFHAYHITTPLGQTGRVVGIVRGPVLSFEKAQEAMNGIWHQRVDQARKAGLQSHEVFVRLAPPNSPESMEIIGVDTWSNLDGSREIYEDPSFMPAFDGVFSGEASTWVLQRPTGDWIEW